MASLQPRARCRVLVRHLAHLPAPASTTATIRGMVCLFGPSAGSAAAESGSYRSGYPIGLRCRGFCNNYDMVTVFDDSISRIQPREPARPQQRYRVRARGSICRPGHRGMVVLSGKDRGQDEHCGPEWFYGAIKRYTDYSKTRYKTDIDPFKRFWL